MTSAADRPKTRRSRIARTTVSLLLGGIFASQLVLSSDAAPRTTTASSCTLNVPARVSINTPYLTPAVTLSSDCAAAGLIEAKWAAKYDLLGGDGSLMNELYFNRTDPSEWSLFDAARLGVWTWTPGGARGSDITATSAGRSSTPAPRSANTEQAAADIPQNSPATDIRLAARGDLVSWNFVAGCKTTFNAVATRYAAKWNGYVSYAGATGRLEFRPLDHSWFTKLADLNFDSAGKASATVNTNGVTGEYRVWVNNVYALSWDASSSWKAIANPSC